jgi:hypothetical protein
MEWDAWGGGGIAVIAVIAGSPSEPAQERRGPGAPVSADIGKALKPSPTWDGLGCSGMDRVGQECRLSGDRVIWDVLGHCSSKPFVMLVGLSGERI